MTAATPDTAPWWHPVWRSAQPMSWLLVPVTLAGVLATILYRGPSLVADPLVGASAVVAEVLIGGALLWLATVVDPLPGVRRPWATTAIAVAWGGGIAVFASAFLNEQITGLSAKLGVPPALTLSAPLVEEALKLVGVLGVLGVARRWLRDPADGLIWGAAVGIGFMTVENVAYAISTAAEARAVDQPVAQNVALSLLARSLLGIGSHTLFTALAGFGLAALLLDHGRGRTVRGVVVFVASVAVAVVAHGLWDVDWALESPLNVLPPAAIALVLVGVVIVLLRRARRRLAPS